MTMRSPTSSPRTVATTGDRLERAGLRAAAAGVPDTHPDAGLLRLCADFQCLDAEMVVSEAQIADAATAEESDRLLNICTTTLWPRHAELVERIAGVYARTREGVAAKAAALRLVLAAEMREVGGDGPDFLEPLHRLTLSLVLDVTAAASAGLPPQADQGDRAMTARDATDMPLERMRAATEVLAVATARLLERSQATIARSQGLLATSRTIAQPPGRVVPG